MTRLYIIDTDTATEGYVPELESHRQARRLMRAMAEDEAKREWRPSVPKWFPALIALAVPAGMFCAALVLEWWLS